MIKRLTVLFFCFLVGINFVKAQNWASGIDEDKFNWGYSFQYVSAEYKIHNEPGIARMYRSSFCHHELACYLAWQPSIHS